MRATMGASATRASRAVRGVPCQGLAPQQLSFEATDLVPASPNADDAAALHEIEAYEEHLAQVEREALVNSSASESSQPALAETA